MSGKAVEASGDVDTLLLDKTGTITLGNRQAVEFIPAAGVTESELADAAQLSSLADETPEGRSIVILAKEKYNLRGREVSEHEVRFIPFTAHTRMSGVDLNGRRLRKGATDAVLKFAQEQGGEVPPISPRSRPHFAGGRDAPGRRRWSSIAGGRASQGHREGGIKERMAQLRAMGFAP